MMVLSEIWRFCKLGLETFLSSLLFFYSHLSLLLISLIPSVIRAYQMFNSQTPVWSEVVVGLTRIFLILLMISILTKNHVIKLGKKGFWDRLVKSCSVQMKKNWPYGFMSQFIVFIAILFGLGNLLIALIVRSSLIPVIEILGFKSYDYTAAHNAYLFFLKNMSVIPLAIVFILKMCGVKPTNN
ncbi:hypothetical protein P5G51_002885 [Virgibacillus sp. 179-BFC.A HS]|uniref:Glycerophosphoryl diester phosphodiesterase membrane domain-containing protein n=1 Tax=Tigheibacillus jepli TaxID=3035914 RepID=A0ABU5CDS6_9BACI|nr:hypothetical protein [Virgibacillus sp. 179-BFC.A HS]MDY0404493.1 hypothetical protein [Virgibacillus sp. 179-BFC.A HS]